MTTHILWNKVYHIVQKMPQVLWVASITVVFYYAIKILFRLVNHSIGAHFFVLTKNSVLLIRVLKYEHIISQFDLLCVPFVVSPKDRIC